MRSLAFLLLSVQAVLAAASFDRTATLSAERMSITSEFAVAQAALRNAKTAAAGDAAQQKLQDVSSKIIALRDKTVEANAELIRILSGQPGYPFLGERDPSATIKATYLKLRTINAGLTGLSFSATPPFQPKDINSLQVILDRTKTGIDEHRHAVQNIETRLAQLKR